MKRVIEPYELLFGVEPNNDYDYERLAKMTKLASDSLTGARVTTAAATAATDAPVAVDGERKPAFKTANGALPSIYDSSKTFLALPRDMMTACLMPRIRDLDLFSLARTCTYMTEICMKEARRRAQIRLLMDKDDVRATPMALHVMAVLDNAELSRAMYTGKHSGWADMRDRAFRFLGGSNHLPDFDRVDEPTRTRIDAAFEGIPCPIGHPIHAACVLEYILLRGTIEKVLKFRIWRGPNVPMSIPSAEYQSDATRQRVVDAEKRLEKARLNIFWGHRLFSVSDNGRELERDSSDEVILNFFEISGYYKLRSHIMDGKPCYLRIAKKYPLIFFCVCVVFKTNAQREISDHSKCYKRYDEMQQQQRGDAGHALLDSMRRNANDDNFKRLSYWMRVLFSFHPKREGALVPCLDKLGLAYIRRLVGWIARETTLPEDAASAMDESVFQMLLILPNEEVPAVFVKRDLVTHSRNTCARPKRKDQVVPIGYMSQHFWKKDANATLGVSLRQVEHGNGCADCERFIRKQPDIPLYRHTRGEYAPLVLMQTAIAATADKK